VQERWLLIECLLADALRAAAYASRSASHCTVKAKEWWFSSTSLAAVCRRKRSSSVRNLCSSSCISTHLLSNSSTSLLLLFSFSVVSAHSCCALVRGCLCTFESRASWSLSTCCASCKRRKKSNPRAALHVEDITNAANLSSSLIMRTAFNGFSSFFDANGDRLSSLITEAYLYIAVSRLTQLSTTLARMFTEPCSPSFTEQECSVSQREFELRNCDT
jgi:hypothetical protein